MISTILNVVFGVVGIVAVIMIIIGGVNYTMSQGDSQKIQKAKNTIMYGIIGLVVVLLAFAIVNFVLNGLLGK
jgi:multisubunit Na+/H+ antiporter MnhB subunit